MNVTQLLRTMLPLMEQGIREQLESLSPEATLYELETLIWRLARQLGHLLLTSVIASWGSGLGGPTRLCGCGSQQAYQDQRHPLHIMTSFGRVLVAKRAAYHGATCGVTTYPLEAQREVAKSGRLSRCFQEPLAWSHGMGSHQWVQQTLSRFHWPQLSTSQIWKHTQALGAEVEATQAQQEAQSLQASGAVHPPPPRHAIEAPRLYVGVDGGRYCTRERDADSGALIWKELKVAVLGEGQPLPEATPLTPARSVLAATLLPTPPPAPDRVRQLSYVTHTGSWETFGPRVWAEAWERGAVHPIRDVAVVADGADPIDTLVETHLCQPNVQVTRILDLRHAQEHVWAVGRTALGEGASAWVQTPLFHLLRGEVDLLCAELHPLTQAEDAKIAHEAAKAIAYFQRHYRHLDYPRFVAQGYQIGSGIVESACKRLGTSRLKGTGMRWHPPNASRVATLRSFALSDRWEEVSSLCGKRAA